MAERETCWNYGAFLWIADYGATEMMEVAVGFSDDAPVPMMSRTLEDFLPERDIEMIEAARELIGEIWSLGPVSIRPSPSPTPSHLRGSSAA